MEGEQENQAVPMVPPFQIAVPFVTRERFSELSGVPLGVVDAWVDRAYIPSRLIGRHRLVNVAEMWRQAFEKEKFL
jgi:hypothetical protein